MRAGFPRFRVLECCVCGYKFSDRHHYYPQSRFNGHGWTMPLCPNHHRYASMIQRMHDRYVDRETIRAVAIEHFDAAFNEKILDILLAQPDREKELRDMMQDFIFDHIIPDFLRGSDRQMTDEGERMQ